MAKVKFFCDSGANIHSRNESRVFDTVADIGLDDGEWESFTDDEKYRIAQEWANDHASFGYIEVE